MKVQAGPWVVESDRDATARAHDRMQCGGPEQCGCTYCRNFVAGRSLAYPAEALDLLKRLGVRADRESRIGTPLPLDATRFLYTGCFHFVGRILEGPSETTRAGHVQQGQPRAAVAELRYHDLTRTFGILLWPRRDLLPDSFEDDPVVQLDFTTELPWLLAEPP